MLKLERRIDESSDEEHGSALLLDMLQVAFARWHVEKWFCRAKQEAGFGAFEVRTYTSLIQHWLCSRMAMYFLAAETRCSFGGKNPQITLEQMADAANLLATTLWQHPRHSPTHIATCCHYHQERNAASYRSRRRRRKRTRKRQRCHIKEPRHNE